MALAMVWRWMKRAASFSSLSACVAGHLDEVAEHVVVADLERGDAGLVAIARFERGDQAAAGVAQRAQLVERRRVALAR